MNIHSLLNEGARDIMKTLGRFYLNNPRGVAFLASTLPQIKNGMQKRDISEHSGLHIPPFLIASIASECNLFCAGCYARCCGACTERGHQADLSAGEWSSVFKEASSLGVSFVLLAGGEPLLRRDVIEAAVPYDDMIFPIFTNGLLLDGDYMLVEVQAPTGYERPIGQWLITVDSTKAGQGQLEIAAKVDATAVGDKLPLAFVRTEEDTFLLPNLKPFDMPRIHASTEQFVKCIHALANTSLRSGNCSMLSAHSFKWTKSELK